MTNRGQKRKRDPKKESQKERVFKIKLRKKRVRKRLKCQCLYWLKQRKIYEITLGTCKCKLIQKSKLNGSSAVIWFDWLAIIKLINSSSLKMPRLIIGMGMDFNILVLNLYSLSLLVWSYLVILQFNQSGCKIIRGRDHKSKFCWVYSARLWSSSCRMADGRKELEGTSGAQFGIAFLPSTTTRTDFHEYSFCRWRFGDQCMAFEDCQQIWFLFHDFRSKRRLSRNQQWDCRW